MIVSWAACPEFDGGVTLNLSSHRTAFGDRRPSTLNVRFGRKQTFKTYLNQIRRTAAATLLKFFSMLDVHVVPLAQQHHNISQ